MKRKLKKLCKKYSLAIESALFVLVIIEIYFGMWIINCIR